MDSEVSKNNLSISDRIAGAKADGTGVGHRLTATELVAMFGGSGDRESCKQILRECRAKYGDDFDLVMPINFVSLDFPINMKLVSRVIIEIIWDRIELKRRVGSCPELTNNEIFQMFGYDDGKNVPVDIMLFGNNIDTMKPEEKFIRRTSNGNVLYSTSEFNSVYKLFTYAGLSPKTVALAYKKVCDAKAGNLVRFDKSEISYIEASDLFNHRTKSFDDTEIAYSVEQFFNIMPTAYVKETAEDFDYENCAKFFLKLIYLGESCVKFMPMIIRCDKSIFKQSVQRHGARAVEEMIKYISKDNEQALNEIQEAQKIMIRAGLVDFDIVPAIAEDGSEKIAVKPKIFSDIDTLKSVFSPTGIDEKNEQIVLSIMHHSKEFCADKVAVSCAIGATSKAYNLASEHILPDKIIVLSIIKKYEEEIRYGLQISVSKKLLAFADSIACDEEFKLIIYALDEFSKIESDDEMRKNLLQKIDEILVHKRGD